VAAVEPHNLLRQLRPCKSVSRSFFRVIIPDSHGSAIDKPAERAFLSDLARLAPEEIVMLGDHVDCGGVFKVQPDNYAEDLDYTYEGDLKAANAFLDEIQKRAPRATIWYLEGNHEQHLERWAARQMRSRLDVEGIVTSYAPRHRLRLAQRGIKYFSSREFHHGLSVRGSIKIGKCYFTHGISTTKHATSCHVVKFGGNIVHGHTHRAQSYLTRTVAAEEIGGWSPGTLAQLQPLYRHTDVSEWSHGYGLQIVEPDGRFLHLNIPIVRGKSLVQGLLQMLDRKPKKVFGRGK
jgi:UDP-2,3-diacylglucosamine pyrophosphatase LpxH